MASNSKDKTIGEMYELAIKDPIKYSIITSLSWYKKLNLTKLSKLINKHESTTFRFIKKLIEDGFIEIDLEKTTSEWGKYYKLTHEVKKIYDKKAEEIEKFGELIINNNEFRNKSEEELNSLFLNELLTKNLQKERAEVLNFLLLQQNVQTAIMNEILIRRQDFKEYYLSNKDSIQMNDIHLKPCDFALLTNTFKISKFIHLFRLYEVLYKFQNEINNVILEIEKDMDAEKVPDSERITQILHLFSSNADFIYTINTSNQK